MDKVEMAVQDNLDAMTNIQLGAMFHECCKIMRESEEGSLDYMVGEKLKGQVKLALLRKRALEIGFVQ